MFTLPALDYDYAALGKYISKDIMELHHSKHHQTYVDKLNAAIEKAPDDPAGYTKLASLYIKNARESGDFGLNTKAEAAIKKALEVSPDDIPGKLRKALASFGLDDRILGTRSLSGSPVQASILLNSDLVKEKIKLDKKGRLSKLMHAEPPNSNEKIVEEIFLAALSRFPSAAESQFGIRLLADLHDAGAEDLLWALLNRPEFLLNY